MSTNETDITPDTKKGNSADPPTPRQLADSMAAAIIEDIRKAPRNMAAHKQALQDLKTQITKSAAELEDAKNINFIANRQELLWNIAEKMPDLNMGSLYQTRISMQSLGLAVILGWLAGGLASTLFGFLGLGGEILRPLAIFLAIWLEEYMCANPRARKIMLTVIGLGGLARFASMVAGGFFRFTGFGSLRSVLFGAVRPNIFKGFWLMAGALFIMAFLSKKISGLDYTAFEQSLRQQISQRLQLVVFVLEQLNESAQKLYGSQGARSAIEGVSHKGQRALAGAVMDILDTLPENTASYLRSALEDSGFTVNNSDNSFIWDEQKHAPLYNAIGLIQDGDKVLALKKPYESNGKTVKGSAQKISGPAA